MPLDSGRSPASEAAGSAVAGHPPEIADHLLLRRIGRGSYGEVWLARNVVGTYRAVKIVHRDAFEDSRPYEREFAGIQKYEPISRMHEGLTNLLQIGRADAAGYFYYVMELADPAAPSNAGESAEAQASGMRERSLPAIAPSPATCSMSPDSYVPRTLGHELKSRGRLPSEECLQIGITLADAVEHLHRNRLVHRDIKPSNVIFVNGRPKLADIGLVAEIGATKSFVGTEGFVAPEGPGTPRSDIFSFGKLLYEMATGKDRGDFPAPLTNLAALPDQARLSELNEVILKACEPDPGQRYASMAALRAELLLVQAGESLRRTRVLERQFRCFRRAAVLALVALLIGILGFLPIQREREARLRAERERMAWLTQFEAQNVEQLFANDRPREAIASLAGLLREDAANQVAAERLLHALTDRSFALPLTPALEHTAGVAIVRWSADGERVVTASQDGSARVWDGRTGQPVTPPLRHRGPVRWVEFSPEGGLVVTASDDGTARVWDVATASASASIAESRVPGGPDSSEPGLAAWPAEAATGPQASAFGDPERRRQLVPPSLAARQMLVLEHQGPVVMANFSPDGLRVVTASTDATARLWDTRTGEPIGAVLGHNDRVNAARFSPDGHWVVTVSDDGTARVWDAELREPVGGALTHPGGVAWAEFSPDGVQLVTAGRDGVARIWVRHAGEDVSILPEQPSHGRQSAPSRVFESEGQRRLTPGAAEFKAQPPLEHQGPVVMASFSPDGLRVVTASDDGTARVWDARNGRPVTGPLKCGDQVRAARFSPDGLRVVTASADQTARVWDAFDGEAWTEPFAHGHRLTWAEFSPDGTRVATSSEDGSACVWDVRLGRALRRRVQLGQAVEEALPSADGRWYLVGLLPDRGTPDCAVDVRRSDEEADVPLSVRFPGVASHFRYSPDEQRALAVTDDGLLRIWAVASGKLVDEPLPVGGRVHTVEFSPDSKWIVTGGTDCLAQLWEAARILETPDLVRSGQVQPSSLPYFKDSPERGAGGEWGITGVAHEAEDLDGSKRRLARVRRVGGGLPHDGEVWSARFSSTANKLVTASGDGVTRLWSVPEGRLLRELRGHQGAVYHAEFSQDGRRVVTAGDDLTARIWDAETGQALGQPRWHERSVRFGCFNREGTRLLTLTEGDAAWLWDLTKPRGRGNPLPLRDRIVAAEFSPDGRCVLARSSAGAQAARLWDVMTGRPLSEPLLHAGPVLCAHFTADGTRVLTGAKDGTITWWEVMRLPSPAPAWLPELASLLVGERTDADEAAHQPGAHRFKGVRAAIAATAASDVYGQWGRWFLADRRERFAAPSGEKTVADYVARQMLTRQVAPLLDVLRLQPTNAVALSRLAATARRGTAGTNALLLSAVSNQVARLAEWNPRDRVALWAAIDNWAQAGRWDDGLATMDRVLSREPETINGWIGRGVLLDWSGRQEEARLAYVRALECADRSASTPDVLRQTMLLNRAALSKRLGRQTEAVADYPSPWNIPPRDTALEARAIDLSAFYNAAFDEAWYDWRASGNRSLLSAWNAVQTGGLGWPREFVSGTPFDPRGLIQAGNPILDRDAPGFPREVRGMPIGQRATRLCFIHAAHGVAPDGTLLGRYVAHFGDGGQCEIPIRYGEDVRAWRIRDDPAEITRTDWEQKTEPNPADEVVRLFSTWWANPRPEVEIMSLDLVSEGAAAAPFLVAITSR